MWYTESMAVCFRREQVNTSGTRQYMLIYSAYVFACTLYSSCSMCVPSRHKPTLCVSRSILCRYIFHALYSMYYVLCRRIVCSLHRLVLLQLSTVCHRRRVLTTELSARSRDHNTGAALFFFFHFLPILIR